MSPKPVPLVIYGAAGAVGAFAIKLACHSDIHPIIAIAGNGIPYVETLVDRSKGDIILDYRRGEEFLINGIKETVSKNKENDICALDCISEHGSFQMLSRAMEH